MSTHVTIDPLPPARSARPSGPTARRRGRPGGPWRWIAAAVLAPLLAGGVGLWWFVLRHDAPAAVRLDNALAGLSAPTAASASSTASGTWNVDTTVTNASGTGSFGGFRVDEQLVGIGAATAVGRSPSVSGSITIEGATVTAARFSVDLTAITSDDARRGGAIQTALATSRYPTATFVLTQPIEVAKVPAGGEAVSVAATGDLTIHGTTNTVTIQLDAQLQDNVLVVVGSAPVTLADFGVRAPTAPIVASVDDHGTIEVQLYLTRA